MHMNTPQFAAYASLLALVAVLCNGCKRDSGIPSGLLSDKIARNDASALGGSITSDLTPIDHKPAEYTGAIQQLTVALPAGFEGRFLTNYSLSLSNLVQRSGATVVNFNFDEPGGEFWYTYGWRKNNGKIRVVWSSEPSNTLKLVVSCLEQFP